MCGTIDDFDRAGDDVKVDSGVLSGEGEFSGFDIDGGERDGAVAGDGDVCVEVKGPVRV